ncbi:uncharacterized protein K02A2.6-like [Anthonomus grandis grandis]|uniref:uncharacterized protein K02A2.6-like n=1 Tax=Anthonomus grandis grandis TaxID=2921223 RepID=UPI002165ED13|nr:uncharacterized protein K02A2.6-like [Anthonomus grandis grandis]
MKALARSYVWWPKIDEAIENIARRCKICSMYADKSPKPSLIMWDCPKNAWTRLHVDFFGPLFNKTFLVVEDATSKWLECFIVQNMSSSKTIQILRKLFSQFGLPKEIATDNAQTFMSVEFSSFLESLGIIHKTGAPFHPETNGLAESGVKILKRALIKGYKDHKTDLQLILDTFLFQYRNTPQTTTQECPSKIIFGRSLRTRFDLLLPSTENVVKIKQHKMEKNFKKVRDISFCIGEKVWAQDYRTNADKSRWCQGVVQDILGRRTYVIEVDDGIKWKRHLSQLKKNYVTFQPEHNKTNTTIIPRSTSIDNNSFSSSEDEVVVLSDSDKSDLESDSGTRVLRRRSKIKMPDRLQVS